MMIFWNRGGPGRASLVAQQQRIHLQCKSRRKLRFYPWVGKIPWRRAWQRTPVFLPAESHEQSSPAGYSPQGRSELNTAEVTEHACVQVQDLGRGGSCWFLSSPPRAPCQMVPECSERGARDAVLSLAFAADGSQLSCTRVSGLWLHTA